MRYRIWSRLRPRSVAAFVWFQPLRSSACIDERPLQLARCRCRKPGEPRRPSGAPPRRRPFGNWSTAGAVALGEQHRALDRVAQLADIARHGARLASRSIAAGATPLNPLPELAALHTSTVEVDESGGHLPGRWRSGGSTMRHHVQPVAQVFDRKRPAPHLFVQVRGFVAATTRTSTRISAEPPTRLNAALPEEAEQLRLEQRHHLADLIEKHRPPVRRFGAARASGDRHP